jgi:hypothetical protein
MRASALEISFPVVAALINVESTMSLLHLVHRSVVIKFSEAAKGQFPEPSYLFRLTGVDAMGFLQIQPLNQGTVTESETQPYWINKDLVREIHEADLEKIKETLPASEAPKPAKKKAAPKTKPAAA